MARRAFLTVIFLVAFSDFVFASGTPGVGWVVVSGGPMSGVSGTATITINGFAVAYNYSSSDTTATIATSLAASLNVNSSPVTAFVTGISTGNVITLVSKTPGSASNMSLSAGPRAAGPPFSLWAYSSTLLGGTDLPRNFRMTTFDDCHVFPCGADADLVFTDLPNYPGQPGYGSPTVPSIEGVTLESIMGPHYPNPKDSNFQVNDFKTRLQGIAQTFNFEMIEAIYVDEPYDHALSAGGNNANGNPCQPGDSRSKVIQTLYGDLQSAATAIHSISPTTRFWVNFASNEAQWIQNSYCSPSLNAAYIDVVSFDQYFSDPNGSALADFNNVVQPTYDWLIAHPAYPGQQFALIPGTFVTDSGPANDAAGQGLILEEYFNYARTKNQSCTLPASNSGFRGFFDKCPVWMVAGFLYHNPDPADITTTNNGPFRALDEAPAAPIQAAWQAQLSNVPVANQAIISIINQILDDNN